MKLLWQQCQCRKALSCHITRHGGEDGPGSSVVRCDRNAGGKSSPVLSCQGGVQGAENMLLAPPMGCDRNASAERSVPVLSCRVGMQTGEDGW